MCGLAGLFLPQGAAPAEADLEAMAGVMRHRGPDATSFYVSDDHRFQAGFVRLSIIDLDTGDQPIVEDAGRRVLMGNGEIYNYFELRTALVPTRYPYRTDGDIEVVLPLHDRYGEDFVHHLNGMYALALYERAVHRLTLVRDRVGIKPLYWTRVAGGGLLFASEVKALFASGLVAPEVDEDAVSDYLAHGYMPAPRTLYRGIKKLPPGHRLTIGPDGETALKEYWRPHPAADFPTGGAEQRERIIELMTDSVRLQLRSDVPVGALLSGGIDSGLVAALAASQTDRPLNTYTVRFEGAAVDETPLAAQVAARYGTAHTEFDLAAGDAAAYLPRLAWFADEPLSDPSLLPNFLISQLLSRSVKVALNGTGGDELFAGYGRYFRLPVERRYLMFPRWLRKGAVEPVANIVAPMTGWRLERSSLFDRDRGAYLAAHCTLFPPPIRRLIGSRRQAAAPAHVAAYRAFREADGMAPQTAALATDMTTYLPEDLLTLLDRTSMAVSVEGRVPLLDHRLVEAALAVPPERRTPGDRQKGLERDIAASFLPADVIAAPKQGFASPVASWLRTGVGDMARRVLTRRETLERGWWTARGIDALLARPERHAARLYALLMLELAVRLHVESASVATAPSDGLEAFADAA